MLSIPMRTAVTALRASSRGLPAKSLTSRVAGFLIAPGYKSRVAARSYATATAKKTTAAAKKPASKKTVAAKKPAAKKTATKAKKTVKSTKKAAAKPKKPAAKKKKVVDPEKQKVLQRRALKRTALLHQEPKNLPASAWLVFTSQAIKADTSIGGPGSLGPKMQSLSVDFRALSPGEKQQYEQKANENKVINAANYKKWVESHTVAEIADACRARRRLIRNFGVEVKHPKIIDERMPKRPAVAGWSYYMKAKIGDSPGQSIVESSKALSEQWKSLSPSEKKPYMDLAASEVARYQKEKEKALL